MEELSEPQHPEVDKRDLLPNFVGIVFIFVDAVLRLPWMRRCICTLFSAADIADTAKGKRLVGQVAARLVGSVFLLMMVRLRAHQ